MIALTIGVCIANFYLGWQLSSVRRRVETLEDIHGYGPTLSQAARGRE